MTNPSEVIISLKKVRDEKKLSYSKILSLMEENGDFLSPSTLSRLFADGSEKPEIAKTFRYEDTLRPIAKVLLDMETIEANDSPEVKAIKEILKHKMDIIEAANKENEKLREALEAEKQKYHEKLEKETVKFQRSLDFAKNQIELKDKRIDLLMEDNHILVQQLLSCPCRNGGSNV